MWDLTLPGYHYLGPGNKLDKGKPRNYNDFVAYIHDLGYGKIIEEGGNPYLMWSEADAEAYRKFTTDDYGGTLGKMFFGLKKKAWEYGLIDKFDKKRTMPRLDPSHGRKRLRYEDEDMTDSEDAPIIDTPIPGGEITSRAMGYMGSNHTKDTPVTQATATYGLPETHTTVIPYKAWGSLRAPRSYMSPAELSIRLTSINDIVKTSLTSVATDAPGYYNAKLGVNTHYTGGAYIGEGGAFPDTNDPGTSERPAWKEYWNKFYEFYQVLSCQYKITMHNPNKQGCDVIVGHGFDTFGPSGIAQTFPTGIVNFKHAIGWKDINFTIVKGHDDTNPSESWATIEGVYKPGQAKTNVQNDADHKAWTAVAAQPTLSEILRIFVWPSPMNVNTEATARYGINVEIETKLIVQFKDLATALKYPTGAAFTFPTSAVIPLSS